SNPTAAAWRASHLSPVSPPRSWSRAWRAAKFMRTIPRVLWRIIDVNVNRAMEGARAAEEFVRFGISDAALTARLRRVRHQIGHAANALPGGAAHRVSARDTAHDVARHAAAQRVAGWPTLTLQNVQRLKESLRVLEECSRALS